MHSIIVIIFRWLIVAASVAVASVAVAVAAAASVVVVVVVAAALDAALFSDSDARERRVTTMANYYLGILTYICIHR